MTNKELTANSAELIKGFVAPGLESVRAVFAQNMESKYEAGATFAVVLNGQLVIDLWSGHQSEDKSEGITEDTLFNLWSTTKGLMSTCIALLVERNALDYDAPVTDYWPQFGANGKSGVTVGELMSHQAGICTVRKPVSIEDFYHHEYMAGLLAEEKPFFEPGGAWGYHGLTIGILADELVRRVDGRTISEFFRAEIATPLNIDAYMGLPEDQDHRQVPMIAPSDATFPQYTSPNEEACRYYFENPGLDIDWPNTRAWRRAGISSAAGSANARGLAKLYGLLVCGSGADCAPLLSSTTLEEATKQRIAGNDQVTGMYNRFAAGYQLNVNGNMGPYKEAFGHDGWGGSRAFGDPQSQLGFAYVMNKMYTPHHLGDPDPRVQALIDATYTALPGLL